MMNLKNLLGHHFFRSVINYWQDGDFITYFSKEDRCLAEQIDERLTVYRSIESNQIIGIKLSGCKDDLKIPTN